MTGRRAQEAQRRLRGGERLRREGAFNLLLVLSELPPRPLSPAADAAGDDAELAALYAADQQDRSDEDDLPEDLGPRDRQRVARMLDLVVQGRLTTGADYLHAAMICQHGPQIEYYHLGFELALRAADLGHPRGRWMAAAAMDRWLMRRGLPQRFGTQFSDHGDGWVRYETDPSVTDDERRAWDVPPVVP